MGTMSSSGTSTVVRPEIQALVDNCRKFGLVTVQGATMRVRHYHAWPQSYHPWKTAASRWKGKSCRLVSPLLPGARVTLLLADRIFYQHLIKIPRKLVTVMGGQKAA